MIRKTDISVFSVTKPCVFMYIGGLWPLPTASECHTTNTAGHHLPHATCLFFDFSLALVHLFNIEFNLTRKDISDGSRRARNNIISCWARSKILIAICSRIPYRSDETCANLKPPTKHTNVIYVKDGNCVLWPCVWYSGAPSVTIDMWIVFRCLFCEGK